MRLDASYDLEDAPHPELALVLKQRVHGPSDRDHCRLPAGRFAVHHDEIDEALAQELVDGYTGKGVRYAGEYIRRKAGKAGKIGGKK